MIMRMVQADAPTVNHSLSFELFVLLLLSRQTGALRHSRLGRFVGALGLVIDKTNTHNTGFPQLDVGGRFHSLVPILSRLLKSAEEVLFGVLLPIPCCSFSSHFGLLSDEGECYLLVSLLVLCKRK